MRFLFPLPDYTPLVTAAIWLASGSVLAAAIWAAAIIYCTHVKYRPPKSTLHRKEGTPCTKS